MESILIVDDERGIRETLSAVLRDEGFVADAVETGEECLKAIARRPYGCVLLDVWLPGINGLDLLHRIKLRRPDVGVVMATVVARDGEHLDLFTTASDGQIMTTFWNSCFRMSSGVR